MTLPLYWSHFTTNSEIHQVNSNKSNNMLELEANMYLLNTILINYYKKEYVDGAFHQTLLRRL